MTTVTEVVAASAGGPVIICDVSPPRGRMPGSLADAGRIDADFLSVAYNPGQSVRINSVFAAGYLEEQLGMPAIFTLATRDMNRIAVQSLLLSADSTGLQNLVVVRGDPIRESDRHLVTTVSDYKTTTLLSDIGRMNHGRDFRGLALANTTSFCAGATVDLSKGISAETRLAARKVEAGAEFLLSQGHFNAPDIAELQGQTSVKYGEPLPVFAGVQILGAGSITFGAIPNNILDDLDAGKSGLDIAKEIALDLWSEGITTFYVIPTILPRGLRDYEAAAELARFIRTLPTAEMATD